MSTINNKPYSSPKNINLKGGILRFNTTQASNPLGDLSYGLYVSADGDLIFRTLTTSVTLGAAGTGGGSAPSLDAIYAGDQTLALAGASLTLAGSHASNDVLTVTNASGTGDCIQITNSGTGYDVEGTSDTWHFSKTGDATLNKIVMAGDDGSNSLTLTAGDILISDGCFALTDADNAASFTITNNSATSASMAVLVGSGAFTGNTTSSFFTVTPSGLTTGTAMYLPLAAITTGKGLHIAGADTQTSGALVTIDGAAGTAVTNTTGALLAVISAGTSGTNAVIAGMSTAATDETTLLKLTASAALALGKVLSISASSMTTGAGISMIDLDSLTTGKGLYIASAATAIATTGRLLYVSHTGATSTSGVLSEFISAATDETTIVKITSAAMVDGINLHIVGTTAMTTGSLVRATTSTAGAVATNGIVSIKATGAYTSTSNVGLVDIGASATLTGTIVHITSSANSQTATTALSVVQSGSTLTAFTGDFVAITGGFSGSSSTGNIMKITGVNTTKGSVVTLVNNALTTGTMFAIAHTTSVIADTGSIMRLSSSSVDTGGSTNGTILDIANTGSVAGTLVKIYSNLAAQTTTCALDIKAAGYTAAFTGSLVKMTGCSTTGAGNILLVTGVNTVAGDDVKIVNNALTLGAGTLLNLSHTTSVIGAGSSMLRITSTGTDTGSTTGTMLDISATAATTAVLAQIASASLTSGIGLKFELGALTTGSAIDTTGIAATKQNINMNASAGSSAAPQTNAPTGFFKIGIGGTDFWVPYYSAT